MPINEAAGFELLFIGNELLIGKTLNTNSQWLTRSLTSLGGVCYRITVIRDDLEEISNSIKEILNRSARFLIISGGLGPTYDDMTLEGVAQALSRPLKIDDNALQWISQKYEELRRLGQISNTEMTPVRLKMARLPARSTPLQNPVGTAPGVLLEEKGRKIICLPGVPQEMEAIFNSSLRNLIISEIGEYAFLESSFLVAGLGESDLAALIKKIKEKYTPYVYVKSHPRLDKPGVHVEFHLTITNDIQCYRKGKKFLEQQIMEAQTQLEEGVKVLGGDILHHEG
ncbi:molybdopterin-binding protein [[Eubacterium] cellulosolvens]